MGRRWCVRWIITLIPHVVSSNHSARADVDSSVVSRAFQILSDTDKKRQYDQTGGDPDSRFGSGGGGGASASPFSGFARSQGMGGRGGGMWEDEISPEDLFRQFFGGGGGFGGGGFSPFGGFPALPMCGKTITDILPRRRPVQFRTWLRVQPRRWSRRACTSIRG